VAKINITTSGTYQLGDGDTAKIDIPGGGFVTLQAPAGDDTVGKIKINLKDNDSQSDVVTVDLSTFDEDGLHIDVKNYDPSDQLILQGATDLAVDPLDSSKLTFSYVGEDGVRYTGFVHIKDTGQQDFTAAQAPIVVCFTQNTLIETDRGDVAVQDLRVGDRILTRGYGYQPVRWIGTRVLDSIELTRHPNLYPVRITAGALGDGLPNKDLLVSPQHRMVVGGPQTQLLFGFEECLVAAKHLIDETSVLAERDISRVEYFHLLFDSHQIVFANGAPSESLYPGEMTMEALNRDAVAELYTLFPELKHGVPREVRTALPVLKPFEAKVFRSF